MVLMYFTAGPFPLQNACALKRKEPLRKAFQRSSGRMDNVIDDKNFGLQRRRLKHGTHAGHVPVQGIISCCRLASRQKNLASADCQNRLQSFFFLPCFFQLLCLIAGGFLDACCLVSSNCLSRVMSNFLLQFFGGQSFARRCVKGTFSAAFLLQLRLCLMLLGPVLITGALKCRRLRGIHFSCNRCSSPNRKTLSDFRRCNIL